MSSRKQSTRRQFIKSATISAAATIGIPQFIPASALGRDGSLAPSQRVAVGVIGMGGRGKGDTQAFLSSGRAQIAAVCDVDAARRQEALRLLERNYKIRGCPGLNDFRELVARDDIEAVLIASPDHWHGLMSLAAARAGKDIYCEKPLAHILAESKELVKVIRRRDRVLQTGSQERSGQARFACEMVRNGRIGKLKKIITNLPVKPKVLPPQPTMPIPAGFDYDMWLGPAPQAPYTEKRCHGNFRWNLDYSDGELTDRGAHVNDIALWGAEPWIKGRMEISGEAVFPKDGIWNTPIAYTLRHHFDNGLEWLLTDLEPRGINFIGETGSIFIHIHGGRIETKPESLRRTVIGPTEIHLPQSPGGHHAAFLDAVRTRIDPVAPVEAGHRTATFCHLGTIALQLGRKLVWDWDTEQFIGDNHANRMLTRPMRSPWTL